MSSVERQRQRPAAGAAPRLYQQVLEILATRIAEGSLAAGVRLNESSVAEQFKISRAPARQALVELERRGLLEKSAGRGYAVRSNTFGGMEATARIRPIEDLRLTQFSSWEKIYGEVESEIAARCSFAGWRVNETELARFYDVSRTVARDVVGRLQQRGIVRKDERSRWIAPAMTPDYVGELYELRWLLEPVALEKAAAKTSPQFIAGMRANLEAAVEKAGELAGPDLDRLEEELHITLLGNCENRTLMQAISLPQALLVTHRFLYQWMPRLFGTEPFLAEHLEIVERLQAGRVEEAAQSLKRHLQVSQERAINRITVVTRQVSPHDVPYLEKLD